MAIKVYYKITGSASAVIEAETLKEAFTKAEEMPGEDFKEADDREWELDINLTEDEYYMDKEINIAQAMERAKGILQTVQNTREWPEDEWKMIAANWDLNIWLDDGKETGTLYHAKDGGTLTRQNSYRIDF